MWHGRRGDRAPAPMGQARWDARPGKTGCATRAVCDVFPGTGRLSLSAPIGKSRRAGMAPATAAGTPVSGCHGLLAIRAPCHNPRPRPRPLATAFRWLTGTRRRRKVVFGPPVDPGSPRRVACGDAPGSTGGLNDTARLERRPGDSLRSSPGVERRALSRKRRAGGGEPGRRPG